MKVAVLKAGPTNQENRRKQEIRFIFKQGTLALSGLNHDCTLARWRVRDHVDELCEGFS